MTTAETIADSLHNDGQNFETDDGVSIDEMLEQCSAYWGRSDGSTVTVFDDGSMIVLCDAFWDIVTAVDSRWVDSGGNEWAELDDDGEPYGWAYRRRC